MVEKLMKGRRAIQNSASVLGVFISCTIIYPLILYIIFKENLLQIFREAIKPKEQLQQQQQWWQQAGELNSWLPPVERD